jgi:hypothetical protein
MRPGDAPAPVLIRVPALAGSRPHVRVRPARLRPRPVVGVPARRRRLRREVRVAGSALLFCVPMAFGLLTFWGPPRSSAGASAPSASIAASPAVAPQAESAARREASPPLATISFEPLVEPTRPEDPKVPVVRPAGYLLPDDGPEESAHAGG